MRRMELPLAELRKIVGATAVVWCEGGLVFGHIKSLRNSLQLFY